MEYICTVMDRKNFLRKGILGTGILIGGAAAARLPEENNADVPHPEEPIGFNHLPVTDPRIMSNMVLHKANTRGHADHGWLNAHHSFSFANYYDPERMHFGVLRVLNDDRIAAGKGFGTHPHDNMEIITIPLSGTIAHKDSMGNSGTINAGEVQVMSAGTGIQHSEFNHKQDEELRLLQIWLFPKKRQVTPRYQQLTLDPKDRNNAFQQVLSPSPDDAGVWIHQDAWFNIGKFDGGKSATYTIKREGNGVYAFVIDGDATINGQAVGKRDGLGVWDIDKLDINIGANGAEILLMDVPMRIG